MSQLLKESFNLFWMALHSFTESLGREGVPEMYVRCTAIMWTRSMEKQSLSLMDTQAHPQRYDTGKTDRRESRCNCHIYRRHETYSEEESFSGKQNNKQSFIDMLSRYLQQANCQVYHSTADADLLIVNKAVESSRTMDTVLVGDDMH